MPICWIDIKNMSPHLARAPFPSYPFWALQGVLVALFIMGGSARIDVQSLAILSPSIVLMCGIALITLKTIHYEKRKGLLVGAGAIFLLNLTYFLPLPELLEQISSGVREVTGIRSAAAVPISIKWLAVAPNALWSSIFFLFCPLSVLLFAFQLKREDIQHSLISVICLGTMSGIVGVLQIAGSAEGPLYLYRITNNGSAVGLFANRNHAAVFLSCLFPILAIFAARPNRTDRSGRNGQKLVAIAIAITLVPLILITGSRAGMLTAIVGLVGAVLLYGSHARRNREINTGISPVPVLAALIIGLLVFVTLYFSRAEAIERIFSEPTEANDRASFWASSLQMFWQFFPFGFGPGGFVPAFQIGEPLDLLSGVYLNRLHNDWLESALTFGVPGILLIVIGTGYYLRRSFVLWMRMDGARSGVALGRMASIVIVILAIASVSDYPLRTPPMAGFAALVLIWFVHDRHDTNSAIAHASQLEGDKSDNRS